jgi:endonuclease G, mitochondrial
MEAAETRDFRICVLSGPVFRQTDMRLKPGLGDTGVLIPEEFQKIVAIVNSQTGRLSVTGYVLSQGAMIRDFVESAFVYGAHKTYQVRVAFIAKQTGLDFGALTKADPLGADLPTAAAFAEVALLVEGPGSLILLPKTLG